MQALNIYIALLERRRLLATVLRTSAEISAANAEADANLSKVIAAMVPHTPTLAAVLSTAHSTTLLVGLLSITFQSTISYLPFPKEQNSEPMSYVTASRLPVNVADNIDISTCLTVTSFSHNFCTRPFHVLS